MSELVLKRTIREHSQENVSSADVPTIEILFDKKEGCKCVEVKPGIPGYKTISTSYYIGIDWLIAGKMSVQVVSKLDDAIQQVDFLQMLLMCMKHPDVFPYTNALYEIKIDAPQIRINKEQDIITPLIILQFLLVVRSIVKKGLKRSYNKMIQNLEGRVKGKILVNQTLNQNLLHLRPTRTYCQFDDFGFDCYENRVLKTALIFAKKYSSHSRGYSNLLEPFLNFCLPAFDQVGDLKDTSKIDQIAFNPFHKEYEQAFTLAKLIFNRFGFSVRSIQSQNSGIVKVPPFWIDMPKLFELYVFGMLKDRYAGDVRFQVQGTYGRPDFVLSNEKEKMIIDSKYKPFYQRESYLPDDIRQLSGYARDSKILSKLGLSEDEVKVVDCLIIYPDQNAPPLLSDALKTNKVDGFARFYKTAVSLPMTKIITLFQTP